MICGYKIKHKFLEGQTAEGVYTIDYGGTDRIFKFYTDLEQGFLIEIDVLMRINHPNIVKGYDVILSDSCTYKKFSHGIVMELLSSGRKRYVNNFQNYMLHIMDVYNVILTLYQNRYINEDLNEGNYMVINNTVIIYDFNVSSSFNYKISRYNSNGSKYGFSNLSKYLSKNIPPNINVKQRALINDLIKIIDNNLVDPYDIPKHKLFESVGPRVSRWTQADRVIPYEQWINLDLIENDYHQPLRSALNLLYNSEGYKIDALFYTCDMYYRNLPHVTSFDQLYEIALACLYIQDMIFDNISIDLSEIVTKTMIEEVIRNLKGNLISQFLYEKCMSYQDYAVCWELLGLKYHTYMSINPDKLYETLYPSYDYELLIDTNVFFDIYYKNETHPLMKNYNGQKFLYKDTLIKTLSSKTLVYEGYNIQSFNPLELMHYFTKNGISYTKPISLEKTHYLNDLYTRTLIYQAAQKPISYALSI
jgi:hypothetical protein